MKNKNNNKKFSSLKKIFIYLLIIFPIIIFFNFAEAQSSCETDDDCPICSECQSDYAPYNTGICTYVDNDQRCPSGMCSNNGTCANACTGTCKSSCDTSIGETIAGDRCPNPSDLCCVQTQLEPPTITPLEPPPSIPLAPEKKGSHIFTGIEHCRDTGECSTEDLVTAGINGANILLGVIASIALLFFIIAGIQMIISQGNSEKISSAKSMMINSVIGLAIALCSFLIVRFVQDLILPSNSEYKIQDVIKGR